MTTSSEPAPTRRPAGGLTILATVTALGLSLASPGVASPATSEPASETTGESASDEPVPTDRSTSDEGPTGFDAASGSSEKYVLFDRMMVVGGPEKVWKVPGSADYITSDELDRQDHSDIHRILRRVPGINVQEEEGYGLRPNIGMRGTGVERSGRITLLEDGVPIAPAPYAAPSAYYFPTPGRMTSFEVMKGASAVRQGPHTTGGVINMLSADFPTELGGDLELTYGEDDTGILHAVAGDSGERLSWLVETYQLQTDGFKDLDGGGDTGVDLEDYLGKLRWTSAPGAERFQAVELKLGHTEQLGDETYLGLTADDFRATPFRRYAASQEDFIDTDHDQAQLRWFVQATERMDVTATIYRNEFFRNWHKLDSVAGAKIADILSRPGDFSREMAVIRGEVDSQGGELEIRNNRRTYSAQGLETVVGYRFGSSVRHDLEVGLRVHEDEEDRFQEEDLWRMADGEMELVAIGDPGSQSNRISSAEAVALFAMDRIEAGSWVIRPGVRFETIDFRREDFGKSDPDRSGEDLTIRENGVDVWVPGIGVDYVLSDSSTIFVGVHRGFAPPGPGRDAETEPEESVNYELGWRLGGPVTVEAVGFYNDYDNLLGRDTLSSGGIGTGELFNGGEVEVRGLELSAAADLGPALGTSLSLPVEAAYTFTQGEFENGFESEFEPWGTVATGDELPYLPEHQLFVSTGVAGDRWQAFLSATYGAEMRTEPGQGPIPDGQGTDEFLVLDLALRYGLPAGLRLELEVRNLTDDVYVAARRPAGARPGLPRTTLAGVSWSF